MNLQKLKVNTKSKSMISFLAKIIKALSLNNLEHNYVIQESRGHHLYFLPEELNLFFLRYRCIPMFEHKEPDDTALVSNVD